MLKTNNKNNIFINIEYSEEKEIKTSFQNEIEA